MNRNLQISNLEIPERAKSMDIVATGQQSQSEGGTPERVMKLAGRMGCQGLLVQAILLSLLSRGRAQCSNGLLVIY